jgi:Mrp family chromosome partitioning ATPase
MKNIVVGGSTYPFHIGTGLRSMVSRYSRFLVRWGWFAVLAILLTTICSYYIPDTMIPDSYQATLQVQVRAGESRDPTLRKPFTTAAFFAGLLQSPGILDMALTQLHKLPQFQTLQLNTLQAGMVTAVSVPNTNIVLLSVTGPSAKDASLIVTAVYYALSDKIQLDRDSIIDGITVKLGEEMRQVRIDEATTLATLQQLQASGQTGTRQYSELSNLYAAQRERIGEISNLQLSLLEGSYGNLVSLNNNMPDVVTVPGSASTRTNRMILSPLVGLIMGLGGALVASQFSMRLPLRGKKRSDILPHVVTVIPQLQNLDELRLSVLTRKAAACCLPLLRRLRYQAGEYERKMQLVCVTSPMPGEGKSTVAVSLAIAAAQSGLKTALIDANVRRPVLHDYFQLANTHGLLDSIQALAQDSSNTLPLVETPISRLHVLPVGVVDGKQAEDGWEEPLRIDGLQPLWAMLRQHMDMIIVDGPALLHDTNSVNLLGLGDATVLVIDAQNGHSAFALESEARLKEMGIFFNVLLNRSVS